LQDICFDDIKIPHTVKERLGQRITHTDTSNSFTSGLAFARKIILSISTDPYWGTIKYVTVHLPCTLLQGGGRILDPPCVADIDITHSQQLCEWINEATVVAMVLGPEAPLSSPLITLLEKSGYFETVLEDKTKQLAIIVCADKFAD